METYVISKADLELVTLYKIPAKCRYYLSHSLNTVVLSASLLKLKPTSHRHFTFVNKIKELQVSKNNLRFGCRNFSPSTVLVKCQLEVFLLEIFFFTRLVAAVPCLTHTKSFADLVFIVIEILIFLIFSRCFRKKINTAENINFMRRLPLTKGH